MALGALDLIEYDDAPSLFGTGVRRAQGTGADVETDWSQDMVLPMGAADLVIMNPPFTRPTGQESSKVGIPVPSFAGLATSKDEQRQMSRRLKGICAKLKRNGYIAGNGNAGLASNFIDLAHVKTKPGGVLAMVVPAACVSGSSWEDARRLLEREYENLTVLTIAAYGPDRSGFFGRYRHGRGPCGGDQASYRM